MNDDAAANDTRHPRVKGTLTGWEDVVFELDDEPEAEEKVDRGMLNVEW